MTGQDSVWQEALSPHLTVAGHKTIHINLLLGRLSRQVKQHSEATFLRTVPDIVHLSVKNAREARRILGSPEEHHGSSVHQLWTILLSLGVPLAM
jgi:hypothetical protein